MLMRSNVHIAWSSSWPSRCWPRPVRSSQPDAPPPVATKGKIGMTCMDLTNPFFKLIANVMEEEAQKHGYTLVALSGELDPAKQNNQLADFAAQGYVAIFLNPVDSKAAGEGVKKAHEAGIPVFTFDVEVTDAEAKDLIVSHIGSDNYQGGLLAGESMMKVTGDRGRSPSSPIRKSPPPCSVATASWTT